MATLAIRLPEIMAPAGSYESLHAAIKGGAGSVYFGVEQLNMRSRSANFRFRDLPEVARICREAGVKSYLTLNTILYDHDLPMLQRICAAAKDAGVSAVIAMDITAIQAARAAGLSVHLSTQANVTNLEALKFYATMADVVVLARELTLKQITHICREIERQEIRGPSGKLVEIELFVHGALCVAFSGKCNMSLATYNASANRGACLQNCRRAYKVTDVETGDELVIDNEWVMSPADLCTLPFLDQIIASGVRVLKIEGRAKGPDYVYKTTRTYAEAARAIAEGQFTAERIEGWMTELRSIFNRGFWEGGYYLGRKISEWSQSAGSQATTEKHYVGVVTNWYRRAGVAEVDMRSQTLVKGDTALITGPTTGCVEVVVDHLQLHPEATSPVVRGSVVTFPCAEKVRLNDKVYVVRARENATTPSPTAPAGAPSA